MAGLQEYQKAILYLLGSGIFAFIYKLNKRAFLQQEEFRNKISKQAVRQASHLAQFLTPNTPLDVIVQGVLLESPDCKLKKTINKEHRMAYSKRTISEIELHRNEKKETIQKVNPAEKIKRVREFALQNNTQNQIIVSDFKSATILSGILRKFKKEKLAQHPQKREIIRKPANDIEEQQQKDGIMEPFTTTILSLGLSIDEQALIQGTSICVFGTALFNKDSKIISLINPKYFAKHKQEIIDYLNGDIYFGKFKGIIYFLSSVVQTILYQGLFFLFLSSISKCLKKQERKGQQAQQA